MSELFQMLEETPLQIKLTKTTPLAKLSDEEREMIEPLYKNRGNERAVMKIIASVMNAVFTQKRIYFLFSKGILEELIKNDPNTKRATIDGQTYKLVFEKMRTSGTFEVVKGYQAHGKRKASIVELRYGKARTIVEHWFGKGIANEQLRQAVDLYTKYDKTSHKTSRDNENGNANDNANEFLQSNLDPFSVVTEEENSGSYFCPKDRELDPKAFLRRELPLSPNPTTEVSSHPATNTRAQHMREEPTRATHAPEQQNHASVVQNNPQRANTQAPAQRSLQMPVFESFSDVLMKWRYEFSALVKEDRPYAFAVLMENLQRSFIDPRKLTTSEKNKIFDAVVPSKRLKSQTQEKYETWCELTRRDLENSIAHYLPELATDVQPARDDKVKPEVNETNHFLEMVNRELAKSGKRINLNKLKKDA